MIICPNLHIPQVAKEFNELKEATSEKAAYHIWSANNGNSIDKAPNGAQSILFDQLLQQTKGNRVEAIRIKSKIYQRDFTNWFGDWVNDPEHSSKAVDANGEPMIVWHGTDSLFDTFEVDEDNTRGRHLFHDKNSFFFTDRQDKALKYKGKYTIPVYLNMRTVGKSDMTSGKFRTANEYIDYENSLIKNDKYDSAIFVRYDKEGDNDGFTPTTQYVVKNNNQIRSIVSNDFSSKDGNIYGNKIIQKLQDKSIDKPFKESEDIPNSIREFIEKQNLKIKLAKANLYDTFGGATSLLNQGQVVTSDAIIKGAIKNNTISSTKLPIANILQGHKVPIKLMQLDENVIVTSFSDENGKTVIGVNQNAIDQVSNEYLANAVLHEVAHAVTVGFINKPKTELQSRLKELNSQLHETFDKFFDRSKFDRQDASGIYYGLSNEKEFIAEFMTNKDFRDIIYGAAVKLDQQNNNNSILGKLKNFVNRISNTLLDTNLFKGYNEKLLKEYSTKLKAYLLNINTIKDTAKDPAKIYRIIYANTDPILYGNQQVFDINKMLSRQLKSFEQNNYINVDRLESTSGKRDTEEQAKKKLDALSLKIARGLSQRLKAVMSSNIDADQKSKIQKELDLQISLFQQGQESAYRALISTMSQLAPQLLDDSLEVLKMSSNNQAIQASELQYQLHDNFGLYSKILESITETLESAEVISQLEDQQKKSSLTKDAVFGDVNDLISMIKKCRSICDEANASLHNILINTTRDILVGVGNETHSISMGEYLDSLKEIGYDTGVFYKYGGMTDKVKDDGIRAITYLVNKALNNSQKMSNEKNIKLLKAFSKLGFGESHLDLYEKDENGRTTQYLVRDLNYGKFYNNYHNFLKVLNKKISKKYGIILDPTNNIAPDDNEQAKVEWNNALNDWLDNNCERPYKKQFYVAYSKLSSDTKYEWGLLSKQIRALKEKAYDKSDGYYHYDRLDDKDKSLLTELNVQKRMLMSDRDYQGNLKEGDELRKAKELQQLHKDLYGTDNKRKIKRDTEAWSKARDKVIEECGGFEEFNKALNNEENSFDIQRLIDWDKMNSKRVLKQDDEGNILLFKRIEEESGDIEYDIDGDGGAKYNEVKEQIHNILSIYRDFTTGEIAYQSIPQGEKIRLNKLAQEQERLKNIAKRQNKELRKQSQLRGKLFSKYTKTEFTEYYKQARKKAAQMDMEYPGTYDNFLNSTSSTRFDEYTGQEIQTPLRWFTKIVARPEYEDEFMEFIPGDGWIEHSENELANPNYDKENTSFLQPKRYETDENGRPMKNKPMYDNTKAFNKVKNSKNLKALYDLVLQTNREINQLYDRQSFDEYLLPKITGSIFKYQKNKTNLSSGVLQYIKDELGIGDQSVQQDSDYAQDVQRVMAKTDDFGDLVKQRALQISDGTRPDGSELNMIPRYYIDKLDDPSQLSSDLIGMMAEAYKLAADYHFKSEVKYQCETIADMMKNRDVYKNKSLKFWEKQRIEGSKSNTYNIAKKFLQMNLYNIRSSDITTSIPWFGGKKLTVIHWNKLAKFFGGIITAINLGMNIAVAEVGFLDAYRAHVINALTGRRYGFAEATKAAGIVSAHIFKNFLGANYIANRLSNDKLMLICEYFNVADQGEKKAKHSNRNRLVNAVNENHTFGMLSGFDFLVKSQIATSVLLSYRYYKGEFCTKEDMDINLFRASKEERKQAMKEWRNGKTAYSILSAKDNSLHVEDEYKEAFQRVENTIRERAVRYSESADGMMTPTQKAQITTTIIGSYAMIHRQYAPLMMAERFGNTVYDLNTQQMDGGIFRSGAKGFYYIAKTLTKFLTGSVRNMSVKKGYVDAKDYYNSKFNNKDSLKDYMESRYINYATKQIVTEIAVGKIISVFASIIANSAKNETDKDKRRELYLLAYIMHRLEWESLTPYRADDMFNNIKSPTAATSVTDKMGDVTESFMRTYFPSMSNSLYDTFQNTKTQNKYNPTVSRGEYKGWSKTNKALFKLLPYHNFYEQVYGSEAKDRYFVNQIMKQND